MEIKLRNTVVDICCGDIVVPELYFERPKQTATCILLHYYRNFLILPKQMPIIHHSFILYTHSHSHRNIPMTIALCDVMRNIVSVVSFMLPMLPTCCSCAGKCALSRLPFQYLCIYEFLWDNGHILRIPARLFMDNKYNHCFINISHRPRSLERLFVGIQNGMDYAKPNQQQRVSNYSVANLSFFPTSLRRACTAARSEALASPVSAVSLRALSACSNIPASKKPSTTKSISVSIEWNFGGVKKGNGK